MSKRTPDVEVQIIVSAARKAELNPLLTSALSRYVGTGFSGDWFPVELENAGRRVTHYASSGAWPADAIGELRRIAGGKSGVHFSVLNKQTRLELFDENGPSSDRTKKPKERGRKRLDDYTKRHIPGGRIKPQENT